MSRYKIDEGMTQKRNQTRKQESKESAPTEMQILGRGSTSPRGHTGTRQNASGIIRGLRGTLGDMRGQYWHSPESLGLSD